MDPRTEIACGSDIEGRNLVVESELVETKTLNTYFERSSVETCLSGLYEEILGVIVALASSCHKKIPGLWY